jgi:hypothetical protein
MRLRKNLLKSMARDAAKSACRAQKQKLAYQKQNYDGRESMPNEGA